MRWVQQLILTVPAMVWRSRVEQEMEAELAAHLEAEVRELTSTGLDHAEARRIAAITMGRAAHLRDECRDARGA